MSDLKAGFDLNRSLFKRIRVTYLLRSTTTAAGARNAQLSPDGQLENPDSQVEESSIVHAVQFLTDGEHYQMREAMDPDTISSGQRDTIFSNEPLSVLTLPKQYATTAIWNLSPNERPRIKLWSGVFNGQMLGLVTNDTSNLGAGFPPLNYANGSWGRVVHRSTIDRFMDESLMQMEVVGRDRMEGREYWIVGKREYDPAPSSYQVDGRQIQLCREQRAWIDPARGYLPVKIEKRIYLHDDKGRIREVADRPVRSTEIVTIDQLPNGGFYPRKIVTQVSSADPDQIVKMRNATEEERAAHMRDFVHGIRPPDPFVTLGEDIVEVLSVVVDPKFRDTDFVLEFPDGTTYYDASTRKTMITGYSSQEYDRLISEASKLPVRRQTYPRIGYLALAMVALAAAVVLFLRSRRGDRSNQTRR